MVFLRVAILDRFYCKGTVLHVKGVKKVHSEVNLYIIQYNNSIGNNNNKVIVN